MRPRIVLFPHGQPTNVLSRECCARLVRNAGGDLQRIIDSPAGSVERFARHIERLPSIREGMEDPMVVLTETNPLALMTVAARNTLERAVPALGTAPWLIYFEPEQDPFFIETACALGSFDVASGLVDPETAPIWHGPQQTHFLIISPSSERKANLLARMQDVLTLTVGTSRVVPKRRPSRELEAQPAQERSSIAEELQASSDDGDPRRR